MGKNESPPWAKAASMSTMAWSRGAGLLPRRCPLKKREVTMNPQLRQAYEREMKQATGFFKNGDYANAVRHLKRAHVLGQRFAGPHIRAHWWMLKLAWRQRDVHNVKGQVIRVLAAAPGSLVSRIPIGKTRVADVNAIKSMPIPDDLKQMLEKHGP